MNLIYIPPGYREEPASLHIDSPDKTQQLWFIEDGSPSLSWNQGRDYRDLTWKEAIKLLFEWAQE